MQQALSNKSDFEARNTCYTCCHQPVTRRMTTASEHAESVVACSFDVRCPLLFLSVNRFIIRASPLDDSLQFFSLTHNQELNMSLQLRDVPFSCSQFGCTFAWPFRRTSQCCPELLWLMRSIMRLSWTVCVRLSRLLQLGVNFRLNFV